MNKMQVKTKFSDYRKLFYDINGDSGPSIILILTVSRAASDYLFY